MLDDFFIRALIAGIGVAIVTGPLGCFVIWRRLSYFGDTLSHSALLGVTLAYSMEFNIALSVFIIKSEVEADSEIVKPCVPPTITSPKADAPNMSPEKSGIKSKSY